MMEINQLVKQTRELFLQNKLLDCIQLAKSLESQEIDISSFQFSQIYRGLSHFELSDQQMGQQCFKNLIEYSLEKKQGIVEEIDVIIRILHQWQNFDEKKEIAYESNEQLHQVCETYKLQNESKQIFNEGIFDFGMSMFNFVEKFKEGSDIKDIEKLIGCLEKVSQFKQELLLLIAWMYEYLDKQEEAMKWYKILEEINPLYPGLANNLAITYETMEDDAKAEEYYLKAVEICPTNGVTLSNTAIFYQKIKEIEKSREFFEKSISQNPRLENTYIYYSQMLFKNLKYPNENIDILLKGLEYIPKSTNILLYLLQLESDNDNDDKCIEYLNSMIEIEPDNGVFEYRYGSYLFDKENQSSSLEYFERCLKKKLPPLLIGYANSKIAYIYYIEQKYTECLVQYFYTCNLNLPKINFDDDLDSISYILDEVTQIPQQQRIEIINSQFGIIQERLQKIITPSQNPIIKLSLLSKQDCFINTVFLIAYSHFIKPYITYKREFNHWDLFLDD